MKSAVDIEDIYGLSPIQQGILFHCLLAPESAPYDVVMAYTLRGTIDVPAFERAWQGVIDRHAILRTSFAWDDLDKPLQVVRRHAPLRIDYLDWRGVPEPDQKHRLDALFQERRQHGLVLSEARLLGLTLIRIAESAYQLVLSSHLLVLDGWSTALVLKEAFARYQAECAGEDVQWPPARPYRDYIIWLQQQDLSQAEAFWRRELTGFTASTPLGVDRPPSLAQRTSCGSGKQVLQLTAEANAALRAAARSLQVTLNTLVQGAWAVLLSRYSGQRDVVFGATVAGRGVDCPGIESMVGLFINTLPVRVQLSDRGTLRSWLKALHVRQFEARLHEHSPLTQVHGWSAVPRSQPLFESLLVFENFPMGDLSVRTGLEAQPHSVDEQTNYPLTPCVVAKPDRLIVALVYDASRFDEASITRMLGHFQTILESIPGCLDRSLPELPLLPERERHQILVEWNDTKREHAQPLCMHELFQAAAQRDPDAVALIWGDTRVTYRSLNGRSNQLARYLRTAGVGPEVLVAICMDRCSDLVVAMLGVLKAGGAYVPLDPKYPAERLAFMLRSSRAPLVLTQRHLTTCLPGHQARVVCIDEDGCFDVDQTDFDRSTSAVTPANLAYVLFTSGSTGTPKGVEFEHRNTVAFLRWATEVFTRTDLSGVLAATSICYDCSIFELFAPLSCGGTAILAESTLHVSDLAAAGDVTFLSTGSSTMAELLRVGGLPPSVRAVNLGGEPTPGGLVRQLYETTPVRKVFNPYGPTECTSYSTFCLLSNDSGPPSIGRPITNTTTYILDRHGAPMPVGLPGELHIGGAGVARGYLNDPGLTAARFVPDPFAGPETPGDSGTRMFRSGDLARYLPDGRIEFLGRLDNQVKIRGFRVEPEEIEAVLRGHPAIRDVVVAACRTVSGDQRLVAFVVPEGGPAPTREAIRAYLKGRLPLHMVPSAVVPLQAMPTLPNGKVDRGALRHTGEDEPGPRTAYLAPRTVAEGVIARVWQEVLQRPEVGADDNFFDLGGHSLLMLRVYSKLREVFRRNIQMVDLFEYPTVASLAAYLSQSDTRESPVQRGDRRARVRREAAARRRQAAPALPSTAPAGASADDDQ